MGPERTGRGVDGQRHRSPAEGFVDRLSFRDHLALSGVIRDEHLPLLGRLLVRAVARGPGDYRDWDRIDAWVDGVARVLTSLAAPRSAGTRTGPARAGTAHR